MPSLALLLQLAQDVGDAGSVSIDAAMAAIEWCTYLEQHSRKVYADELSPGMRGAEALAQAIAAGKVRDGDAIRDIYRHHWSGLTTSVEMDAAVAVLVDAGWVRVEQTGQFGRPSEVLRLHPALKKE